MQLGLAAGFDLVCWRLQTLRWAVLGPQADGKVECSWLVSLALKHHCTGLYGRAEDGQAQLHVTAVAGQFGQREHSAQTPADQARRFHLLVANSAGAGCCLAEDCSDHSRRQLHALMAGAAGSQGCCES